MVRSNLIEKVEGGREYRAMRMEIREAEDGKMMVEGYATVFNQPYILYEGKYCKVIEQVDPKAFEECDMSDVIFQYDHGRAGICPEQEWDIDPGDR